MSCKIQYQGKTFDTAEEFLQYAEKNRIAEVLSALSPQSYQQVAGTESSKASPATLRKVNDFLSRIGVNVAKVNQIVVNGQKLSANGMADALQKLIQVVRGKEDVALTEEAMHMAVEMLEQTNPILFKQMFNQIGSYEIFKTTLAAYRNEYKNSDGTADLRKIKKEAIAKLLAEHFILSEEGATERPELLARTQSWWDRVLDFFKGLFNRAGFDPFRQATAEIKQGTSDGDFSSKETYLQTTDDQVDRVYSDLVATHQRLAKNANNKYELDGVEIPNRVTDKVKAFYEKVFPSDKKKAGMEATAQIKAEKGTKGHADLEDIFHRYVDDQGYLRDTPLPQQSTSQIDPNNNAYYAKLEEYLSTLLNNKELYPEGTRFLSEVMVYDGRNEAGTMDFVAIVPQASGSPKVDIRDWKFTDVSDHSEDVPWYKKKAFDIQISEYKDILNKKYGVSKDQFRQTRAIPILTKYSYALPGDKTSALELSGISVGNVDPKRITDLRLLPVATKDESTGNKKLDKLLKSLNDLYEVLRLQPVQEGRRDLKNDRLNQLERAIRTLQIQGDAQELIKSATEIIASVDGSIQEALGLVSSGSMTKEARQALLKDIFEDGDILQFYTDMHTAFREVDLEKGVMDQLRTLSDKAANSKRDLQELVEEMGQELATGYGIRDILDPEKLVSWAGKYFSSFSEAKTKAVQVFRKIWNEVTGKVAIEADERYKKLEGFKEALKQQAASEGTTVEKLLERLKGKNKQGLWNGELIRRVQKEAYTQLKEHQAKVSEGTAGQDTLNWFDQNLDHEAYQAWFDGALRDKEAFEATAVYHFDNVDLNEVERQKKIEKFRDLYDPSRSSAFGKNNKRLSQFIKEENFHTPEYKELLKPSNKALLDFYTYWQERMKTAYDAGMIDEVAWSRFVPNVRRTAVERAYYGLTERRGKQMTMDLFASLAPDVEATTTSLSGDPRHHIKAAYVHDLAQWRQDKEGNKYADYSQKSDDLLKVMGLFDEEILKFQHKTEIENEIRLLHTLEKNKKAYQLNRKTGEQEVVDNKENAKYFENFMNYYVYNLKYEDSSMDASFKLPVNKVVDGVNKATKAIGLGEVLPRNEKDEVEISFRKGLEAVNRWFQLKTLGINVPTSITNFVGGKINAYIQSGDKVTKGDLLNAEALFVSNRFHTEEGQKIAGLLDYFFPFQEGEKRVKYGKLSVKGAASHLSSDWLMHLQRTSDTMVKIPIQIAHLMNTMVQDGKLVNIRDWVKEKQGYAQIYNLSAPEREQKLKDIEREVEELKKTASLLKVAQIENDRLVIPGINRSDESALHFTHGVHTYMKNVLGNMDENDRYQYRMNVIFNSVMMFKNWIPRMVKVRYGGMSYNVDTDNWEVGRYRLLMNGLIKNLGNSALHCMGVLSGKESLIEKARTQYQKYRAQAGEDFMNEAEFIDMYLKSGREAIKEVLGFTALLGMFLAAGAMVPPKDADGEDKLRHHFMVRLMDKTYDELAFFYNPVSLSNIANGSIFPALGVLTDVVRFSKAAGFEAYYAAEGDDTALEKNKVAKYAFRSFPITKELMTYVSLFNYDFAKSFGIQIQSNYAAH